MYSGACGRQGNRSVGMASGARGAQERPGARRPTGPFEAERQPGQLFLGEPVGCRLPWAFQRKKKVVRFDLQLIVTDHAYLLLCVRF